VLLLGVGEDLATLVLRERAERRRLVTFVPPAHVCVSTPVKTFCQTVRLGQRREI
jgi:hypothetical protein